MGKQIVNIKIDVTKIDKKHLYVGSKGTYLDLTLFLNDEVDQFGNNGMVVQSIPKEARDKGEKGAILGNGKIFQQSGGQQPAQAAGAATADDLPF